MVDKWKKGIKSEVKSRTIAYLCFLVKYLYCTDTLNYNKDQFTLFWVSSASHKDCENQVLFDNFIYWMGR